MVWWDLLCPRHFYSSSIRLVCEFNFWPLLFRLTLRSVLTRLSLVPIPTVTWKWKECLWMIIWIRCGYCNEEHYKCDEEVQWSYMYAPITVKSYGWSGRTGGNWTLSKNYFSSKYSPWGQNMVLGQIPVKYLQSEVHERQLTLTIKKLTLLI